MSYNVKRHRVVGAISAGAAVLASLGLGVGAAAAAAPADPAARVAPNWNNGVVNTVRTSGSDTTFFMLQKIGDLYTGAGLYGCTLNSASGDALYAAGQPGIPASGPTNYEYYCKTGANVDTTDAVDNWSRTEIYNGVDDVGSGAGQNQLCGALSTPYPVDLARSSKPAGTACPTMVQAGYAKDGVPIEAFPSINPSTYGTSGFSGYQTINGGSVGPVAAGWLPGDPVNGSANNGTPLSNISNNDNGGGAGSTAYRLWCATNSTRITDWGQLTNLGPVVEIPGITSSGTSLALPATTPTGAVPNGTAVSGTGVPSGTTVASGGGTNSLVLSNGISATNATLSFDSSATGTPTSLAVGGGVPIGVPIRIVGLNPASGTEATFAAFANSGTGASGGCNANMNADAANDPAVPGSAAHLALENNSSQTSLFAIGDFPGDVPSQAIEQATSLYIISNGVYNTSPYSASTPVNGVSVAGTKITENGTGPSTSTLLSNAYPTARTLFNIYRSDTVKASTAGFVNWICDSNSNFTKGTDNSTGKNFDSELTTIIQGQFGFTRLTDTQSKERVAVPADGVAAPNTSCASGLNTGGTAGNGIPVVQSVPVANLNS